ncbi:dynein light chain 1, putative [Plasmodium vinckei brucechwatti]|uniref:Dynein light chain 1, putative n=1 Tax=Plasmodium vinckei brucechwatti TaxID=119398 RepID=A0A6V7RZL3_PLAVN|nr:dynein light chain 1, putative [Plasmodium vinckei brucechwatti]
MNRVVKEVTISHCIKSWEQKTGKKISEEENVSFICNIPLIEKLDQSINTLEKCKRLSLSTNRIEKLVPMPGLKNIEILSIGRNCIKKLQFLEDISGTLKQLWISYNNIDKLDNLQSLKNLQNTLPELIELGLKGNPIYEGRTNEYMKLVILKKLPQLKVVDNETITEKQRNDALTIEVI